MTTSALLALLLVLALNLWATAVVFRANDLESRQRALQALLIWSIPVIGAAVVLLVRWSYASGNVTRRSDTEHEHWQNAQDKAHGVE